MTEISDRFSWARVAQFAAYNMPGLRKQLVAFLVTSLLFSVLLLLPLGEGAQVGICSLAFTTLQLMFALAPVVFAKSSDTRIIDRLVPCSAGEKLTFYLIYLLVVIPAVTLLLPELSLCLYTVIPAIQTEQMLALIEIRHHLSWPMATLNCAMSAVIAMVCFLVVLKSKRNRAIWGIVSVFVFQIVYGIIGAIWGFTAAFQAGLEDGMQGNEQKTGEEIAKMVTEQMTEGSWYIYTMIAIMVVVAVYLVWDLYRTLRNRNL